MFKLVTTAASPFSWVLLILAINLPLVGPGLASNLSAESGKSLFQKYCQECHGPHQDGRGNLAPELEREPANLRSDWTQSKTDDELFAIIKQGGGVEMHGWADTFTDQDIHAIVDYLRKTPF